MRLIDADKLIKSIESDRNCSDMPSQWIDGVNYAIDLIELYEPTIDIVRCGECENFIPMTHGCKRSPSVEPWWEEDFCSYGERLE